MRRATAGPPQAPHAGWPLLFAEVALAGCTMAAALGFARVFTDWTWTPELLGAAAASHLVAAVARRLGLPALLAALLSIVAMCVVLTWILLPDTTSWLLPTGLSRIGARTALSGGWETFRTTLAPVAPETGLLLASAVGLWVAALLADTAAFRVGAPFEAAVPSGTVFLFVAALGTATWRTEATALWFAALLLHALAQRLLAQTGSRTWLTVGGRRGWPTVLQVGAGIGAVGVLAAMLVGPSVPGAGAGALIPWRASDRADGGPRVTVSPLVDIRSRLVQQSDVEVFTVEAAERAYWRLASLETFDGRIWSSRSTYRRVGSGDLPGGDDAIPSRELEQRFTIRRLDTIWLPAAYRATAILEDPGGVRYGPDAGTLLTDERTADGLTYSVRSRVPVPDASLLDRAPFPGSRQVDPEYLRVPEGFSEQVIEEARRVTDVASSPYQQALALQGYFRGGDFVYDQTIPPGHGDDAIERFLFETKRGYCEQFAGTFAAMARAVGLPARVAVGFTPGEAVDEGRYVVRGLNAHAWPEVYLHGAGWVAFEPTPGRGMPGAQDYTGVPEAQAAPVETDLEPADTGSEAPDPADVAAPIDPSALDPGAEVVGGSSGLDLGDDAPSPWPRRLALAALAVPTAALAWMVALGVTRAVQRARRRREAASVEARVLLAWHDTTAALTAAGVGPRPSETPHEYARRAAASARVDAGVLRDLAGATTVAECAPPGSLDEEEAAAATTAAAGVVTTLRRRSSATERVRAAVDPRPLLPASKGHVVVSRATTRRD